MRHWVVYEDETVLAVEADHFTFESSYLTLTRWVLVLMRPREVVIRRLPLRASPPVLGVLADQSPVG
jgi:hypothetical protein